MPATILMDIANAKLIGNCSRLISLVMKGDMAPFKLLMFDSKQYDEDYFNLKLKALNLDQKIEITYKSVRLNEEEAQKVSGFDGVCLFVNDVCDEATVSALASNKVKLLVLRCAGFNNVAVKHANSLGLKVVRVPAYSPFAVAEHSVALLLTLNRHLHTAYNRVRNSNFSLDNLVGFDLHGKTVGVVGTGKIGKCAIAIFKGFGCHVLAFDIYEDKETASKLQYEYTSLDRLLKESDVISLYAPLTKENYHMINSESINKMKHGVYIVNTGRGPLIDANALLEGLKNGKVGGACLDVYENESGVFYNDMSSKVLQDDVLARFINMPNVIITSHQAYLTSDALDAISCCSLCNIKEFLEEKTLTNVVTDEMVI
ncbi:hypothetical protein ACOME3_006269 [Neoechinorhynchus agilis]